METLVEFKSAQSLLKFVQSDSEKNLELLPTQASDLLFFIQQGHSCDDVSVETLRNALKIVSLLAEKNCRLFVRKRVFQKLGDLADAKKGDCEICAHVLDALHAVVAADSSTGHKRLAAKHVMGRMIALLEDYAQDVSVRSRAAEILNALLVQCAPNCTLFVKMCPLTRVMQILEDASDFLLQSVVFEVFFRLTLRSGGPSAEPELKLSSELLQILQEETLDFADQTRRFLVAFNASLGKAQKIFSFFNATSNGWVDFCVTELQTWSDGDCLVMCYKDMSEISVTQDGRMEVSLVSGADLVLELGAAGVDLVRECVVPRMEAVFRAAQNGVKTAIVSFAIPAVVVDSVTDTKMVEDSPKTPPSSLVVRAPEDSLPPFTAPKPKSGLRALSQSLPPPSPFVPQSPLAQTLYHFGAVVEQQLAQEAARAKKENDALLSRVKGELQLQSKRQQQELRMLRKRARDQIDTFKVDLAESLDSTKRACFQLLDESLTSITKQLSGAFEKLLEEEESVIGALETSRFEGLMNAIARRELEREE